MSVEIHDRRQSSTRVMALHAIEYCERLFYLEEVEEIRVADKAVYDGRRLHEQLPEYVEVASLTLESDSLRLYGKVDVVRSAGDEWIPFEYKKGHARKETGKQISAWPSDEIQVAAYAMLLEEYYGHEILEGRVFYAADHRTVVVPVDTAMRARVAAALERADLLRRSTQRPSVATNERLCARCSLAPICLPEEERFAMDEAAPLPRYFPPDRDLLDVHVTVPGSSVRRSGGTVVIDVRDGEKEEIPTGDLGSLNIHGNVQITTQTLHMCSHDGIHVHWFTGGGKYVGSLANSAEGVQRRLRQYAGLTDSAMRLRLAASLAAAKVESQLRYMLRLSRGDTREVMTDELATLRECLRKMRQSSTLEEVRGWEGLAGRAYFGCLSILVASDGAGMELNGRNRRPPRDPANALLSFWYEMLYRDCVEAIITVGLDPAIGILHQPRSSAYPLAMDLMELFRVSLCDTVFVGSVHRKQWRADEDFVRTGVKCWLNDEGRKKAIQLYERRKQDVWKHPVIGYSLSYDRALELEVRLLEKEWSGAPGLFANNRIR